MKPGAIPMRHLLITACCVMSVGCGLLTLVTPSFAYDPRPGDKMVYGAGMVTWAEWQQHRSGGNKVAQLQLQAWIDGFLSGYNAADEKTDLIAPKPESVAYYAWIDNYCGQKPLSKVMEAVMALKNELVARSR